MKDKIKKVFKSRIFLCILTALLTGTVSVYAVTYFPSNQVTYDNKTSGLKSSDVQGAIDELYNTCSSVAQSGDYIYYTVNNANNTDFRDGPSGILYRMTLDGEDNTNLVQKLSGYTIDSVYVADDYIYYTVNNASITDFRDGPSGILYRMTLDGEDNTNLVQKLSGNTIDSVYVTDDYIYYTVNNALYRMTLDGEDNTNLVQEFSGYTIDSIFIK